MTQQCDRKHERYQHDETTPHRLDRTNDRAAISDLHTDIIRASYDNHNHIEQSSGVIINFVWFI